MQLYTCTHMYTHVHTCVYLPYMYIRMYIDLTFSPSPPPQPALPMCSGSPQQDACVNPNDFQLEVRVSGSTENDRYTCRGQNEFGSVTTNDVRLTRIQCAFILHTYIHTHVHTCVHTPTVHTYIRTPHYIRK